MKYIFLLLPIFLQAATIEAQLFDLTLHTPIKNAEIIDSTHIVHSNSKGKFSINSDDFLLHVKKVGYRPYRYDLSTDEIPDKLYLEPINIKALYLNFWAARKNSKTLAKILKIIDNTDVNAIVMDVKSEAGLTSYKTSVKKAAQMGAHYKRGIKDIAPFIKKLKERNIYLIARIVVFKDNLLATKYPKLALRRLDGSIFKSRDKMLWIDPSLRSNHKYVLDIAKDAAKVGFDEINFDYVRFPASTLLQYSVKNSEENRIKSIESFLRDAKKELSPYGVFISADTYGEACWKSSDINIGHTITSLAKYSDYVAPMLYPSGFFKGTLGFKDPTDHNFEIIYRSIINMQNQIDPIRVRPWLQAFRDYAHDRKRYKKEQLFEQTRASVASSTNGWMFWNPSSRYSDIGLEEMLIETKNASILPLSHGKNSYNYCQ